MAITGTAAAIASTITSVAGTALSAIGAMQQAKMQEQVAKNEAFKQEQNRLKAIEESRISAQDADQQAAAELGALIANAGASGIDLGSGSKALAVRSQEKLAARDRARIIHAGEIDATNYENNRRSALAEASGARSAGRFAMLGGALDIGSSLISGATQYSKASLLERTSNVPTPRKKPSSISGIAPK